jgi:hypothetical protein
MVRVKAQITGQSLTESALANEGATWQMRQLGTSSTLGQSHASQLHFGLGDASVAKKVRVEWPSGQVTTLSNIPVNQTLTIHEPAFFLTLKRVFRAPNGTKKAVLKWDVAAVSTGMIDFYIDRTPDGNPDFRTTNDNKHKLKINAPGDGPFFIRACEMDSATHCSNIITADFADALVSAEPDDDAEEDVQDNAEQEASTLLVTNYPNPFNPATTITYVLPEAAQVNLIVYDVLGQRVRTLVSAQMPAGQHNVRWDGRTETGVPAASGIYLYRLTTRTTKGLSDRTGRMLLGK